MILFIILYASNLARFGKLYKMWIVQDRIVRTLPNSHNHIDDDQTNFSTKRNTIRQFFFLVILTLRLYWSLCAHSWGGKKNESAFVQLAMTVTVAAAAACRRYWILKIHWLRYGRAMSTQHFFFRYVHRVDERAGEMPRSKISENHETPF